MTCNIFARAITRNFLPGIFVFFILTCAIHLSECVAAVGESDITEQELRMLPQYCVYTQSFRNDFRQGNDQNEISRWKKTLGATFEHLHHYCNGLVLTNRVVVLRRGRRFDLEASINEFNYVIRLAPAEFVLLPEILTKKGENLLLLDKVMDGTAALMNAIALKPDYWPPYAAISDYHKKIKNITAAREWLEKGIAASPDSTALRRRLTELGATK